MLEAKSEGNYHYLPSTGVSPFCSGVVADSGYEIVRATFEHPLPWRRGYELIDEYLKGLGRPRQALCELELRCAAPYTREGFLKFNAQYAEVLSDWGLYGDQFGTGSTARTNIAPSYNAPSEQVMVGFAYTVPSDISRQTFIVSGTPAQVRKGEASADAISEQIAWMVSALEERMNELGVSWNLTTDFIAYTPFDIEPWLREEVVPRIGPAVANGIRWFPGHAPVGGGGIEMGTYGVVRDIRVPVD